VDQDLHRRPDSARPSLVSSPLATDIQASAVLPHHHDQDLPDTFDAIEMVEMLRFIGDWIEGHQGFDCQAVVITGEIAYVGIGKVSNRKRQVD
jgi:hypothetical protein